MAARFRRDCGANVATMGRNVAGFRQQTVTGESLSQLCIAVVAMLHSLAIKAGKRPQVNITGRRNSYSVNMALINVAESGQ